MFQKFARSVLPLLLGGSMLAGCASTAETTALRAAPTSTAASGDCQAIGNARPICGFQNPEDLVALPDDDAILVSEFGSISGGKAGVLSLFVPETEERRVIFRGGDAAGANPVWGDAACPGPPGAGFSPHGVHLSRRSDGALQLLVVQHGGRESVEFFEVTGEGRNSVVQWRGCALAPGRTWLNSVAATPDGGFVATNMMDRPNPGEDVNAAFAEARPPSGYVVTWNPARGFGKLPGSEGAMLNGIEVSPDGQHLFVNYSTDGQVRKVDRATGAVQAVAKIPHLDNARWAPDGSLVVASLVGGNDELFAHCMNLQSGACPVAFNLHAVDPETMEHELLYGNKGTPMGAGTVGLVVGDEVYVGTFAGDRILRVRLDR